MPSRISFTCRSSVDFEFSIGTISRQGRATNSLRLSVAIDSAFCRAAQLRRRIESTAAPSLGGNLLFAPAPFRLATGSWRYRRPKHAHPTRGLLAAKQCLNLG